MATHGLEDFDLHVQEVRARRAQMRESITAVVDAIGIPLGKPRVWRERVKAALSELAHDFEDHVSAAERSDSMFNAVVEGHPRLARSVETLLAEHTSLRADIAEGLAKLDSDDANTDLAALREELTRLAGRLVRHRQRGSDLVYEAYSVDLGGQG